MKFILRLKAWQLFIVLMFPFWVPTIFNIDLDSKMDPLVFNGILIFWLLLIVGWAYAVGTVMHRLANFEFKPNIIHFKLYCCFLPFILAFFLFGLKFLSQTLPSWVLGLLILFFTVLYFYLIFSIWLFAARMLESMIQGKLVGGTELVKFFMLFWIFPIGVWIIQPTVQRIIKANQPVSSKNE